MEKSRDLRTKGEVREFKQVESFTIRFVQSDDPIVDQNSGFPLVGGDWGTSHELYVPPHNSCVPPHKIQKLSPPSLSIMTKIFSDIFSIFAWQKLIWPA